MFIIVLAMFHMFMAGYCTATQEYAYAAVQMCALLLECSVYVGQDIKDSLKPEDNVEVVE
jgi:hypothetical protein